VYVSPRRRARSFIGALLVGKRGFQGRRPQPGTGAEGAFSGTWHGPSVVVTHEPVPTDSPDVTFAGTSTAPWRSRRGRGRQVRERARANIARQCLDAGLLDELQVNVIPIVLGEGVPFFDGIERPVELEGPEVVEGTGVTHLRYRVVSGHRATEAEREAQATARDVAQRGRADA
jgi:hypothetical protein